MECIIAAIRAYDAGVAHQFKSARLYEIEFEGVGILQKPSSG